MDKLERREIEREIETFRQRHEQSPANGDWRVMFFNNFWMNLPGPMCRRNFLNGALDQKPSEEEFEGASPLLLGQTWRSFFNTVQGIALAREFDEKYFAELINYSRAGYAEKREEIFTIIQPIYVDLREKGYNHYPDLTI